ncbi:MAG: DUF2339 domain-containing protein [Cytophagaceae bacterium]|nr:DUF2339 domain-containing protein [Gemmatimonadaceae bacterium]
MSPSHASGPASNWNDLFKSLGMRPATPSPAVDPAPAPFEERRGLEDLVGRYGTIGLASLTILMGIGALIGWAIRNGYIGPMVRIAIGLVTAGVVAFFGWRVRRGDSPRYGNALLALALAIVHVVSWGAGPRLQLISTPAVLALAALSSAALAWLAWHEDDQTLFNVGFGGALLAPFVTSDGSGRAVMLLSYGFVVLAAGIASLGQRTWTRAPLVASLGILVYTASGAGLADTADTWAVRTSAGAFAVGLSALASVLLDGPKKMAITYPALVAAFGAMVAVASGSSVNAGQYPFAVALMVASRFAGDRARRGVRTAIVGGVLLPAGATALALGALPEVVSAAGAATALLFAFLAALAAWQDVTGDRRTYAFTATALTGLAVAVGSDERQLLFCLLIAAFGLLCAVATQRLRLGGIGVAGAMWLAAGTVRAFTMLEDRVAYEYAPFLTEASLAAASIALSWILLSFHTARNLASGSRRGTDVSTTVVRLLGAIVAFAWVRQELARAFSPDVSAFLVIAWYAISGVMAIFLGHARGIPLLRQLGLGLSVLAALTTITQASSLVIGWRVGSYLLAGAFLLGVAYSYRVTRPPPRATPTPPDTPAVAPEVDPA